MWRNRFSHKYLWIGARTESDRWFVVDNFYFWYCVEGVIFCHEGTDALAEVTDMYADIIQEDAACPLSHDHDCFRVHFGQIEFHGEP